MKRVINRRSWFSTITTILASAFALTVSPLQAKPKSKVTNLNITPVVNSVSVNNAGQLVASGLATVTVKGQTFTSPFTAPIQLAASAPAAVGECSILNLSLGPMLGESKNQFSLTRGALSTTGRAKSNFLSVEARGQISPGHPVRIT
jgi:hypothetical protein